ADRGRRVALQRDVDLAAAVVAVERDVADLRDRPDRWRGLGRRDRRGRRGDRVLELCALRLERRELLLLGGGLAGELGAPGLRARGCVARLRGGHVEPRRLGLLARDGGAALAELGLGALALVDQLCDLGPRGRALAIALLARDRRCHL